MKENNPNWEEESYRRPVITIKYILYYYKLYFTVNPRHAWPVFLKFEWSFEIYMLVLNIAKEISDFPSLLMV